MSEVEVVSRRRLLDGFFKVDEVVLRHRRRDGAMSPPLTRLHLDRGDGAAVVLHDRERGCVVLVRQLRFATCEKGPGWPLEVVAGVVPPGETPEDVARREALEEVGCRVPRLEPVGAFYLSPGVSSERIFLYYGEVSLRDRRGGGGLDEEGEDIEVVELPLAEAWAALDRGAIVDAKTLIGLMWLRRKLFSTPDRQ